MRLGEGNAGRAALDRRTVNVENLAANNDAARRSMIFS
jgi:hypothetical protein